ANGTIPARDLTLPDTAGYTVAVPAPGAVDAEATAHLGTYLRDIFTLNAQERDFRLFSPDETISNKLDAVFEVTDRAFVWPTAPLDEHLSPSGRVMEILSEHTCQGWLEGYLLTGRHGFFASYEAFITIVDSMVAQYAKWLKEASEIPWRRAPASLNYLLTSHLWRQDHNGFSHQSPAFIDALLNKKSSTVRVYLPPDANTLMSVAEHCLRSRGYVNVIIAPKHSAPQWLDAGTAATHCALGASVWDWAGRGDPETDPDIVLAAAGDVPMTETLGAAQLLREQLPALGVRVVNVVDLFSLAVRSAHPHGLDEIAFAALFTASRPVIFAFHGYPHVIHELLHHRPSPERFHVRGFEEEGTTSTPFDAVVRNGMSRYHLAIEALRRSPLATSPQAGGAIESFERQIARHRAYIVEHDDDLPEIRAWRWRPELAAR
ncbi:MAG TPA: phosphoketolase family protein, partial [Candidatus Acidoferrales bacterium]|nr:phosphoketolase family protein [Candidatus Acidoferrales bacterium]